VVNPYPFHNDSCPFPRDPPLDEGFDVLGLLLPPKTESGVPADTFLLMSCRCQRTRSDGRSTS
jgi:hypothetical protein